MAEDCKIDGKIELSHLEKNLLRISEEILQYKKMHYQDDIERTLLDIYCIKQIEKPAEAEVSSARTIKEKFKKSLKRLGSLPHRNRGSERFYLGIDGETYTKSELNSWENVKELIIALRKKIKKGEFKTEW